MKSRGRLSPWITPRTIRPPCSEAHLRAGAGVADQDAGAETSQHVYGKPKHGRHGRCLQGKLGAAAGDVANFGERLGAAAFERMCGTEFAGEYQPGVSCAAFTA